MDEWTARLVDIAERACEIAGIDPALARQSALVAVAGYYAERAERARLAAHWAETMHARRERIVEAERHEETAKSLMELAEDRHGIRPSE